MTPLLRIAGGWWPRFSPDGRRLCFGFRRGTGWAPVEAGATAQWIEPNAIPCGWLSNDEIVCQRELTPVGMFAIDVRTNSKRMLSAYQGSHMDAADGHWALNQTSTGRVFYDGRLLASGRCLGVAVKGEHLVTSRRPGAADVWVLDHYVRGNLLRTFDPPTQMNFWRVSDDGHISYGLAGPVKVMSPAGSILDVTAVPNAPRCGESPADIFYINRQPWCVTQAEMLDEVSLIVRPLGERRVIQLNGAAAVRPVAFVEEGASTILVAGNGTDGLLEVFRVPTNSPRTTLVLPPERPAPIVRIDRPLWHAFYTWIEYALPANADLRAFKDDRPMYVRTRGGGKIGRYVTGQPDGDLRSLEEKIAEAKFQEPDVDVIAYWPRQLHSRRVPEGADVVAVEGYVNDGERTADATLRISKALRKCKRAALIAQCYTSNNHLTSNLTPLVPMYARLARDQKNVEAVLVFSGPDRPKGWLDHPEVHSAWRELFAGIPQSPSLPERPTPTTPTPTPRPPEPPLMSNRPIILQAHDKHFVAAEKPGSPEFPKGALSATRTEINEWERYVLEPSTRGLGRVQIRTAHGTYVTAEGGGGGAVVCNRTNPVEWESFKLVPGEGANRFAFQCWDGTHFLCAEEGGGRELNATRIRASAYESFIIDESKAERPIEPGPVPPIEPPADGRKGIVRGQTYSFVDDGGQFLAWGQSLFWSVFGILHEADRIERHLEFISQSGSDFFRAICTGLRRGTLERSVSPRDARFQEAISKLVDAGARHGLRTQLTIFGAVYDAPEKADRRRAVEMVCEAVRGREQHVWAVEIANEGSSNGFPGEGGARELKDLADLAASRLPNLVSTTGLHGTDDIHKEDVELYYKDCRASLQMHHYSRLVKAPDGIWRPSKKPWRERLFRVEGCATLVQSNEPRGPESSGSETNDPLVLAIDAANTWLCGVGSYVQHSGAGIYGVFDPRHSGEDDDRPADLWDTVNIREAHRAIENVRRFLPSSLPNWAKHQADSRDNPFEFTDVPEEQFTCAYAATRGEDCAIVPTGVVRDTTWRLRNGGEGTILEPVSGATAKFENSFRISREERARVVIARKRP